MQMMTTYSYVYRECLCHVYPLHGIHQLKSVVMHKQQKKKKYIYQFNLYLSDRQAV